jgi:hypothetical protein
MLLPLHVETSPMRLITIVFLLSGLALPAAAQKGYEVGGFLGAGWYFGDLNSDFDLAHPGPSAGLLARSNLNERLCLALTANYAYLRGDDQWSDNPFQQARNLSFVSHVFDFGGRFEFNFMPYRHGSKDNWFTPYVFGGISVTAFNPRARFEGQWYNLRDLGTEGQFPGEEYYVVQPALNYGLGMKVDITYGWSLNLEIDARYLWTDYLDDVSTVYPDKAELLAQRGEVAVALSDRSVPGNAFPQIGEFGRQRGDSQNKDSYSLVKVGLVYYFGGIRCPAIVY